MAASLAGHLGHGAAAFLCDRELQLTKKSASGRTVAAIPTVVTCVYGAAEMPEGDGNRRQPIFQPARGQGQVMRGEEVTEMLTCWEDGVHEGKSEDWP